ncbi:MAG: hypothetical protein K8H86_06710, partial [Ignavibacteriaceae bacterium]|nr:hypothetical protein [Ignavibacteriaceae bacterium]
KLTLMFDADAVDEYKIINAEQNNPLTGFVEGGHFILRNKNINIFVEAGEIGKRGLSAPGHNETFHSAINLGNLEENNYTAAGKNSELKIIITGTSSILKTNINTFPFSEEYGKIETTNKITIVVNDKLPASITTEIKLG